MSSLQYTVRIPPNGKLSSAQSESCTNMQYKKIGTGRKNWVTRFLCSPDNMRVYIYFFTALMIMRVYLFLCSSDDMRVCILLMFCAEGDNCTDGLELAKHLNSWLNIIDMEV